MTEQEAISILRSQFADELGFIERLNRGEGIDYTAVEQARAALDELATQWSDRAYVPKHAIAPLVDVYTRIVSCKPMYIDLDHELEHLASDFVMRIDQVFYRQPAGMTEEEAVALVYGHFRGLSGIALAFHHHESIPDFEWAAELKRALDTLAVAWRTRQNVPKAVAGPMMDAHAMISGHAGNYDQLQTQLEQIGGEVLERVRRCLRD